jgi:hypothetical protein
MLIASLCVIIGIAGALVYALSKNTEVKEMGRLSFAAGIFAICFQTAAKLVILAGGGR